MRKQAITTLFTMCMLLLSYTAMAQTRIIAVENDGIDPTFYNTDPSMNAIFSTPAVRVANINDIVKSNDGQFPPGTEPLFLKFELGNIVEMIPLDYFEYETDVNGYPVFKSEGIEFVVNLSGICPSGVYFEKYGFSYQYSLVTGDGSPYPIHDTQYSNPNGIFSCRVFTLTCPDCEPKGYLLKKVYPNLVDPIYSNPCPRVLGGDGYPSAVYSGAIECTVNQRPGRTAPTNGFIQSSKFQGLSLATIQPNPFTTEFQLAYRLTEESQVNISIFNAHGQLMYQSEALREANVHEAKVDTRLWAEGIYFCRIQSNTENQLLRIVKTN